jgi:hypothetical protein
VGLDRIILSFRKPFLSFQIYLLLIWLFIFIFLCCFLRQNDLLFKIVRSLPFWKRWNYRAIMWSSLVKIQYTELKLCGNDPVVKNSIYSSGDLDLWPNDPKINRLLPLPQGNHVAKFGKDLETPTCMWFKHLNPIVTIICRKLYLEFIFPPILNMTFN